MVLEECASSRQNVLSVLLRLERISVNMSQLEAKVDSAVASHGACALQNGGEPSSSAAPPPEQPTVEQAPSTAASVRSDFVEEINAAVPAGSSGQQQQPESRAGMTGRGSVS